MSNQHGIPVMFDIEGGLTRHNAAVRLCALLAKAKLSARQVTGGYVESWWFIEAEDKHADRNDNAPGEVVFDSEPYGYLVEWNVPGEGPRNRYFDEVADAVRFRGDSSYLASRIVRLYSHGDHSAQPA